MTGWGGRNYRPLLSSTRETFVLHNSGSYELLKIKSPYQWGGTLETTMTITNELCTRTGLAHDSKEAKLLRSAPRIEEAGALLKGEKTLEIRARQEYILEILRGETAPLSKEQAISLKAFKTFLGVDYAFERDNIGYYVSTCWNGTNSSAYPKIKTQEGTHSIKCQMGWTFQERLAYKVGQLWGQAVKACPSLEKKLPLVAPKPAPVVKPQPAPAPALKTEKAETAADFKAIIKAMKLAEVSAELILKTLESL